MAHATVQTGAPPRTAEPYDVITESDIMLPMRDGVRLATDVHRPAVDGKPATGAFPVLVERTPYGKNNETPRERSARDPRPKRREEVAAFFAPARLRCRHPGPAWPLPVRRPFHQVPRRSPGRPRDAVVGRGAALVQWTHRDVRPFLRRSHSDCADQFAAARSCRDVSRLRRVLQCVSRWHTSRRRLRVEAGDVGVQAGVPESRSRKPIRSCTPVSRAKTSATGSRQCPGSAGTRR
jgi:hypothetical protein